MRITVGLLERKVAYLNKVLGYPNTRYNTDGNLNVGTYMLDMAYGRYSLEKALSGNGVKDVFDLGHMPKRELYYLIVAYMKGIEEYDPRHV